MIYPFVVGMSGLLFPAFSATSEYFLKQLRCPCSRVLADFFLFYCHKGKKPLEAFVGDVLVEMKPSLPPIGILDNLLLRSS